MRASPRYLSYQLLGVFVGLAVELAVLGVAVVSALAAGKPVASGTPDAPKAPRPPAAPHKRPAAGRPAYVDRRIRRLGELLRR